MVSLSGCIETKDGRVDLAYVGTAAGDSVAGGVAADDDVGGEGVTNAVGLVRLGAGVGVTVSDGELSTDGSSADGEEGSGGLHLDCRLIRSCYFRLESVDCVFVCESGR